MTAGLNLALSSQQNLATIKRRTPSIVARNHMTDTSESTPAVADLLARARVYVEGSHAKQTLEAYAADWKHFSTWCEEHKRRSLPAAPETMALRADAKRHHLLPGGDRRLLPGSDPRPAAGQHQLPPQAGPPPTADTGHKNIAVLRRSIREGSVFRENAAAAVGL
jgi:hypothetical protein